MSQVNITNAIMWCVCVWGHRNCEITIFNRNGIISIGSGYICRIRWETYTFGVLLEIDKSIQFANGHSVTADDDEFRFVVVGIVGLNWKLLLKVNVVLRWNGNGLHKTCIDANTDTHTQRAFIWAFVYWHVGHFMSPRSTRHRPITYIYIYIIRAFDTNVKSVIFFFYSPSERTNGKREAVGILNGKEWDSILCIRKHRILAIGYQSHIEQIHASN